MKERFLVTTAIEETWPEDKKSVIFLGEWCRLYSRKNRWMQMDSEVLPYHWDNRDKLKKDYEYLRDLFERLLSKLTDELNSIHGVGHTSRYWRTLIGPWLMMYLSIIFDRWECLELAVSKYPKVRTKIYVGLKTETIPQCMEHFSAISKSDIWNQIIYSSILKFIGYNRISAIPFTESAVRELKYLPSARKSIARIIKDAISTITSIFSRDNNYFIIEPYLSIINLAKLQIKLRQFPVLNKMRRIEEIVADKDSRKWCLADFDCSNKFEQFAIENIPLHLPLAYLEGYKKLKEEIDSSGWPKFPKLIWTSNSFFMDDMFKLWAAEKVDEGVPLVIGQHGGHYGQGLFSFTEYLELTTSDYYLSWGWKNNSNKVIPVGSFKKSIEKRRMGYTQKSLLLLISGTPRYGDGIMSIPIASQWLDYLDDQLEFYGRLPVHITNDTIVRLYPSDYGWSQRERWLDNFPSSNIDEVKVSLNRKLLESKLVISGWNSTTYLESMLSNIPTVIFWENKYFELRDDAMPFFDCLREVGIFHDSPASAANHVKKVWGDIDAWWDQPEVVSVRKKFLDNYAYSNDVVNRISNVFEDLSANHY